MVTSLDPGTAERSELQSEGRYTDHDKVKWTEVVTLQGMAILVLHIPLQHVVLAQEDVLAQRQSPVAAGQVQDNRVLMFCPLHVRIGVPEQSIQTPSEQYLRLAPQPLEHANSYFERIFIKKLCGIRTVS